MKLLFLRDENTTNSSKLLDFYLNEGFYRVNKAMHPMELVLFLSIFIKVLLLPKTQ